MKENIIVGLINSIAGLFFMLSCIPLVRRRIKMNDLYGFRISKAFESEQNWYDINEYGARKTMGWSIFTFISGVAAFFISFEDDSMLSWLWVTLPISLTAIVPIVQTFKYSKRI
jgi:hypothetical protein